MLKRRLNYVVKITVEIAFITKKTGGKRGL